MGGNMVVGQGPLFDAAWRCVPASIKNALRGAAPEGIPETGSRRRKSSPRPPPPPRRDLVRLNENDFLDLTPPPPPGREESLAPPYVDFAKACPVRVELGAGANPSGGAADRPDNDLRNARARRVRPHAVRTARCSFNPGRHGITVRRPCCSGITYPSAPVSTWMTGTAWRRGEAIVTSVGGDLAKNAARAARDIKSAPLFFSRPVTSRSRPRSSATTETELRRNGFVWSNSRGKHTQAEEALTGQPTRWPEMEIRMKPPQLAAARLDARSPPDEGSLGLKKKRWMSS
ncbi:hypothetical protein MTO96_006405 [Rhipicephalus appendiculatus]